MLMHGQQVGAKSGRREAASSALSLLLSDSDQAKRVFFALAAFIVSPPAARAPWRRLCLLLAGSLSSRVLSSSHSDRQTDGQRRQVNLHAAGCRLAMCKMNDLN